METAIAFVFKHWRALSLGLVLLFLTGWHFQDKISDWWDDRKIHRLEEQVSSLEAAKAAQDKRIADLEASAAASQAARDRNDREVGRIRSDTQGRVDRAADADAPARVRDVQGTLDAYRAAAGAVRGAGAR